MINEPTIKCIVTRTIRENTDLILPDRKTGETIQTLSIAHCLYQSCVLADLMEQICCELPKPYDSDSVNEVYTLFIALHPELIDCLDTGYMRWGLLPRLKTMTADDLIRINRRLHRVLTEDFGLTFPKDFALIPRDHPVLRKMFAKARERSEKDLPSKEDLLAKEDLISEEDLTSEEDILTDEDIEKYGVDLEPCPKDSPD